MKNKHLWILKRTAALLTALLLLLPAPAFGENRADALIAEIEAYWNGGESV